MKGVGAKEGNVGPLGAYTAILVNIKFLQCFGEVGFARLIKRGVTEMCGHVNVG